MEMVVCSGVAIRLCRDKAWEITIHLRQGYGGQAKNAPFSDRNKSFQAFLKTFEIASKISRKTGTNSGDFTVSRNGDSGEPLGGRRNLAAFFVSRVVFDCKNSIL